MRKGITVGLVIAALVAAGCGGAEEATLDDGRQVWLELGAPAKTDLVRACRSRAAADLGNLSDSAQVQESIEGVDIDALIGRIDEWYAQERPRPGPISEVCFAEAQDLAATASQSEIERLEEEFGSP